MNLNEVEYIKLMAKLFQARDAGEEEDDILHQLDTVWFTLTDGGIERTEAYGAKVARDEWTHQQYIDFANSLYLSAADSDKC